MFVKLDDNTILDMATGTCYKLFPGNKTTSSEVLITFNGSQTDKTCSRMAVAFWLWLDKKAMKFGKALEEG